MQTPYDIEVTNRQSFIKFLELLHQDILKNKNEWENSDLERFLEAMIRYSEAIQEYFDNTDQNINANITSWKVFADILKGAKVYE